MWNSLAMSPDGNQILASVLYENPNVLVYSSDGGQSWVRKNAPVGEGFIPTLIRSNMAASADLRTILFTAGEKTFLSTDGGNSFKQTGGTGLASCGGHPYHKTIAVSGNGQRMMLADCRDLWTSADRGASWVRRADIPQTGWDYVASSFDGLTLAAVSNSGQVLLTRDGGTTWTTQTGTGENYVNGLGLAASGTGAVISDFTRSRVMTSDLSTPQGPLQNTSFAWTRVFVDGASDGHGWNAVASSADGTKLIATEYLSGAYVSNNHGLNWRGLTKKVFGYLDVAISSNGQRLFQAGDQGVSVSADGGVTWALRTPSGGGRIRGLSITPDGRSAVASGDNGMLNISHDYGQTWLAASSPNGEGPRTGQQGKSVAMCGDGQTIWWRSREGLLSRSVDDGTSWTAVRDVGGFGSIYCAADSKHVVAGRMISSDGGANWSEMAPPMRSPLIATCSTDCRTIAIGDGNYGSIYISDDYGASWTREENAGGRVWSSVTVSADGSRVTAVSAMGAVLIGRRR